MRLPTNERADAASQQRNEGAALPICPPDVSLMRAALACGRHSSWHHRSLHEDPNGCRHLGLCGRACDDIEMQKLKGNTCQH